MGDIPWYVVRAAGLVAFISLYSSILFGLMHRIPKLNKDPAFLFEMHKWLSINTIALALIHAIGLVFDSYVNFSLPDVFVPFIADFRSRPAVGVMGLGIISFYLILIITVSSLLTRHVGYRLWRYIHFLNITVYILLLVHIFLLGTDLKIPLVGNIFILANLVLIIFFGLNFYYRRKKQLSSNNTSNSNPADQT